MNMKILFKLSAVAVVVMSLSACGSSDHDNSTNKEKASVVTTTGKTPKTQAWAEIGTALPDGQTLSECEETVFAHAQDNSDLKIKWGVPIYSGLGTYARIKKVTNAAQQEQLLMVFSDGPDIRYRTSDDKGLTWSDDYIVASPQHNSPFGSPNFPNYDKTNPEAQYNYTNAEFVELTNGDWIISYNARPKGNETTIDKDIKQPGVNFDIRTMTSHDKGATWEAEKIVVEGGNKLERGIWEPIILELPNEDLQMYYADEEVYYLDKKGNQQISMLISYDKGETWIPKSYGDNKVTGLKVSYRDGFRDGMPVPMISNNHELILAIEDNGQDGHGGWFKPAIVRTSVEESWSEGFVRGDSQRRNRALVGKSQIPKNDTSGGTYIDQFPSGEIVMSAYSSQCRNRHSSLENAIARVYVGDENARNFSSASTPFAGDFVGMKGRALWSSVTVLDDNTVLAVAGLEDSAQPHSFGLYVSIGKVTRK